MANKNPEQIARDSIDQMLEKAGWQVQDKNRINFAAGKGIAIREYPTDIGPADYILFVDRIPCGVIEAKKPEEGHRLRAHETQAENYASSKLNWVLNQTPLPFIYESTGILTHFTNQKDPKARAQVVYSFHRPETIADWFAQKQSLKGRLQTLPALPTEDLRDCQINAIRNLETSFQANRPKALIQMATGSGKTFTAITSIYRLLKFADAKRILFLVDTKNLGEQAEQEFFAYTPSDDNRKFTELYNVQLLNSRYIAPDSQVCISTIQRMYSILKGQDLDERKEEQNPNEFQLKMDPQEVQYNPDVPIEMFDFIVIDECHRSIYNLWRQVLEYFDAFLIGLTATPDTRTFGFFNQNVVSEYSHEEAVADGVNVGFDVYTIETRITNQGNVIEAKEFVDKRDRLTRQKRWTQMDEEFTYRGNQLDKDVVNKSQIRTIIQTFKKKLPEIFPQREEIPKTLIFAKTDSHADDIIEIVREEFGESNAFCKKVTYQATNPKSVLSSFRNDYYPRIAVTVDMIATGTDIKPLECLLFLRDVRSRNYFEQMKGRGTRTFGMDDMQKVTPSAKSNKTHFVIIDAVGVTQSLKSDSRPLERKRNVLMKDLLYSVMMGARDEDTFLSLANRLTRLEKQMTPTEKKDFNQLTQGKSIGHFVHALLDAHNPDKIAVQAQALMADDTPPSAEALAQAQNKLIDEAAHGFHGELNEFIEKMRSSREQILDPALDVLENAGWNQEATEKAKGMAQDFSTYLETHKDEIAALSLFYSQPFSGRDLTFAMIKDLLTKIKAHKPVLAPLDVWEAYAHLDGLKLPSPKEELVALVALVRRVVGLDESLTPYEQTVNRRFQNWVFDKQSGSLKFNEQQMEWLRLIKQHIANSFHIDSDDLDFAPFDAQGGLGKMHQLFGERMDEILEEMNEALTA
jgi:type I restriction enzyme R subunit